MTLNNIYCPTTLQNATSIVIDINTRVILSTNILFIAFIWNFIRIADT